MERSKSIGLTSLTLALAVAAANSAEARCKGLGCLFNSGPSIHGLGDPQYQGADPVPVDPSTLDGGQQLNIPDEMMGKSMCDLRAERGSGFVIATPGVRPGGQARTPSPDPCN